MTTTLIIYLVAGIPASFAVAVAVVWCICAISARDAQWEEDHLGIRRS